MIVQPAMLAALAWTVTLTATLGVAVSAVWGISLGYSRKRRTEALKDRTHLFYRVHRAHANAQEWAPLLCVLVLGHQQLQGTDKHVAGLPEASVVATLGFTLHKVGLLRHRDGKAHWDHAVGFALQSLGLLYLSGTLLVGALSEN
jgi:uncharacterized membrane protein YecN with MAPEG domain